MARTGVTVKLQDTAIGTSSSNEGVAMLVLPVSPASPLVYTPVLVTSLEEAQKLAGYSTLDAGAKFQVSEFYSKAGSGSKLWLTGYDDYSKEKGVSAIQMPAIKQVIRRTTATLWDNRPRLIGFVYPSNTEVPKSGLAEDLTKSQGAIQNVQGLIQDMFAESYRMVAVLDAGRIGQDIFNLPSGDTYNAYGVALALTTPDPTYTADVGRALGILARINPAQSIGQMTLGSVSPVDYFVNSTTPTAASNVPSATNVAGVARSVIDDIGAKQYLFTRARPGNSGVYYNDGATLNKSTNALSAIEFVRVANGVCDDAEYYFQQLINTQVPVTASGDIDAGYKSAILATFRSNYIQPRLSRGDASEIEVTLEAKDGNFVKSRAFAITIRILPNATLREAFITTFFVTSLE